MAQLDFMTIPQDSIIRMLDPDIPESMAKFVGFAVPALHCNIVP